MVNLKIATILLSQGKITEADALVQSYLSSTQAPVETAMLLACKIMLRTGRLAEASGLSLSLIAAKPADKPVRELFGEMLASDKAASSLVIQQVSDPSKPSVSGPLFGFISTLARDQGQVEAAVAFIELAVRLQPDNISYLLNYVHLEEILFNYEKAISLVNDFLRRHPSIRIGHVTGQVFQQTLEAAREAKSPSEQRALRELVDSALMTQCPADVYSEGQLETLALLFTTAKMFYLTGRLFAAGQLCRLIQPLRENRELHKTLVRNEHAFFACVFEIVKELAALPDSSNLLPAVAALETARAGDRKLFVVGDSHVLPLAWHRLADGRVIHPLLVTGCKIWHLRKAGRFFPKANFNNALERVPAGSSVIMVLGEIDCREGFPKSVQDCRYETIEEGCLVSIRIFLKVLLKLIRTKNLSIYVHPISPALDPTRFIVQAFNSLLKAAVIKANEPALKWLDFVDKLLTEDGSALHQTYYLDGTHLSTRYREQFECAFYDGTPASSDAGLIRPTP